MHTNNGHNGKLTLKSLQSEMTNRIAGLEGELQQATNHPNFNGQDTPRLKFILAIVAGCTTPLLCLNWQAWSFAIGLDFAITVSELVTVWGSDAIADVCWLPHIVIWGAVVYSAALNSFINLKHAGWSGVQDYRQQ